MDYDIVIVGAGPAGLNAAYYAAKIGAEVLVVDKKIELGKPVRCGEAIVENILKDFNIKSRDEFISNYVNSFRCISSIGKEISVKIKLKGYILDRVKFEQYLGARAEKVGAKIQLDSTVIGLERDKLIVTKDKGKTNEFIKGKIIIGADGVESRIGRWAGLDTVLKPTDIASCCQYLVGNIEVEKNVVEFYWGAKYAPHGYTWVFPKSATTANVGIVTIGKNNMDLKVLLDEFKAMRAPKNEILKFTTGCVPQGIPPKQVVHENVILAGDAARVAIPVTGAGIGNAMLTGKWAGNISGEIISNNLSMNELIRYEKLLNKIRRKIRRASILKQKIIRDNDIYDLLFAIFAPFQYVYDLNPTLAERFLLKNIRY